MKKKINKKLIKIIIIPVVFIFILILILNFIVLRMDEDSWIKDSRGVWIKHGNPSVTPSYVFEQQEVINCALGKFETFSGEINSQCLGVCNSFAVDIVHVPRNSEDDKLENQCEGYINGNVIHFIELDKDGNIVRIS